MNWPNALALAAGMLLVLFALLRAERKRLWVVVLVLAAPTAGLIGWWANLRQQWPEVLLALALAGGIAGGWWLAIGRKLPAPTSDNIKVWGQENVPKPKPQELQAEIQKLKEDKERLEAELRRLKEGGNGHYGEK